MIGYLLIGGMVMLGLIIVIFYKHFVKQKTDEYMIMSGPTNFNEKFYKEIELPDRLNTLYGKGHGITIIWDMYIPNTTENRMFNSSFDRLKPIIRIGNSPHIYYHPKKGYLSIISKYTDNPFYSNYPEIKYDEVKLQKWERYILVIKNRSINLFVGGKLKMATTLLNIPIVDTNRLIKLGEYNNNFQGKVRNLKIIGHPLDNKNIQNIF
jgi:hypothetical protein